VPNITEAALKWYDAGYHVIAAKPGKRPADNWREYQNGNRIPRDQLIASLKNADGFGIITGTQARIEMLEVEGRATDTIPELVQLAADNGMTELLNRVLRSYRELTPTAGFHWFYRVEGTPRGNRKLARRPGPVDGSGRPTVEVLWETRGQGGFTVLAPSAGTTHGAIPDGRWLAYGLGAGRQDITDIPVLTEDERDQLHALIGMLDRMPTTDGPATTTVETHGQGDGLRPGDQFNATANWDEILTPHGWTKVGSMGNGYTWRRPGKDAPGISATTGQAKDGVDRLYVFSTSTPFDSEKPYSKFAAFAVLNHGGNYTEAVRALRARGFGANLPPWPTEAPAPTAGDAPETAEDGSGDTEAAEDIGEGALAYRIDWHAAYSDEDRAVSWLVEGIIERGRLVAMYSAPKAGKSLLALDWAAALATGRALPGHPATGEIVPVLYCDYENTPADIVDRLRDLGYHDPGDLAELHYLSLPVIRPLDTHPGGDALLAAAKKVGAQLVIIDTASRTISGEENAADTWAGWYACTGIKLKRAGIALLRLDHSGKDATRGQRGSSAKAGDVDLVLRLVADGDRLDLTAEERRQAYYSERVTYHRREANGVLRHHVTTAADARDDSVTALIDYLDGEGIPPDAGRPAVKAYLDERGYRHTKRTLEAALRGRRVLRPGADQGRAGRGRFVSPPLPTGQRAAVPGEDMPLPTENDGCPPLPTAAQRLPAAQTGGTGTAARAAVSLDTGSGQAPQTAKPLTDILGTCNTCGKPAMTDPCTACRRDIGETP
jgi:hypothetical protein